MAAGSMEAARRPCSSWAEGLDEARLSGAHPTHRATFQEAAGVEGQIRGVLSEEPQDVIACKLRQRGRSRSHFSSNSGVAQSFCKKNQKRHSPESRKEALLELGSYFFARRVRDRKKRKDVLIVANRGALLECAFLGAATRLVQDVMDGPRS